MLDPNIAWIDCRRLDRPQEVISLKNSFQGIALFRFGHALDLTRTWEISGMLRDRLMACSRSQLGFIPEFIHGHPPEGQRHVPHVAFSPRAAVSLPDAPGGLQGIALLQPITPTLETDRALLNQILSHPDLQEFKMGSTPIYLQRHESRQDPSPQEAPYLRSSHLWASLTPVMLDQFPRKRTIEQILTTMLEREGIPMAGAKIQYGKASYVRGAPPASRFHLRATPYYQRPFFHLWFQLAQPVRGPVTLGTTRHIGLGHFVSQSDN